MEALPSFRFHPDPVGTGSIVAEDIVCTACSQARDHRYVGPIYTQQRPNGPVCPWCIEDGTLAAAFQAEFVDAASAGSVDDAALEELRYRTPGYLAWQQDVWLTHCGYPCIYLGPVGQPELEKLPASATTAVKLALRGWGRTDDERDQMLGWQNRDGNLTGYLFICDRCGEHLAHVDAG